MIGGLFGSGNIILPCILVKDAFVYVIISATGHVSCNFDDEDICGYQDLSESGISWSHIRTQCELISYCIYDHD